MQNASVRAALGDATSITIETDGTSVALQLQNTGRALDALKACEDRLLRGWGVDPATRATLDDSVQLSDLFGPQSYPPAALRDGASGQVIVVVTVDPEGKPTACRMVASSGNAALDEATCRILERRARYKPADAGRRENRSAVASVHWYLQR